MPNTPNRYSELSPANRKAIDNLINTVASKQQRPAFRHATGEINAARRCIQALGTTAEQMIGK